MMSRIRTAAVPGGDARGNVDAAHIEMRKLVGEGARKGPRAGLDRPDVGGRIEERAANTSHSVPAPPPNRSAQALISMQRSMSACIGSPGRSTGAARWTILAGAMTAIDPGQRPARTFPGRAASGRASHRGEPGAPTINAARCSSAARPTAYGAGTGASPACGDDQRGMATATIGDMSLRRCSKPARSRASAQASGPCRRPTGASGEDSGKPRGIEAEAEVAEHRRRRLDRQQHPARRQRFAQTRQLPTFRQAVQALGREHEIVARSLEAGVRLQQSETVVPMRSALGGLEATAVRLDHRQLDIVAALDLDQRRRERTETDLQDAQRASLGPQRVVLEHARDERARFFEGNARGIVEVEDAPPV